MSNNCIYVNWDGHKVKLTWIPTNKLPPLDKVTSVHSICIKGHKVLLVKIKGRGFNHPGGHVDEGETPEQALHREVLEEGYVKGDCEYLGMIEVNQAENPMYDPNGKYPKIGYQLFYSMNITECLPFNRENESISRIWVEPSEVPYVINDHNLVHLILNVALEKRLKT
ncbi:NUDIX domain-containing protein [Chengkuizengella sediminis]|uniref:NUDIX domain-containing protein n=1 Tax=Chengkuizengella sediminis TaxID=1885917 RepID=UPI0023F07BC4|nr:NUDIX domain-containing protein [Chengkuizengella sediminis]